VPHNLFLQHYSHSNPKGAQPITEFDSVESSIVKAGGHASALQVLLSLSPGSWIAAYKKALLVRLELQYALAILKLGHETKIKTPQTPGRTIDLERGLVQLSSHISDALRLCKEEDYDGCASELYAADALVSKVIPKLKKEDKK
jgi:hypothetical protein